MSTDKAHGGPDFTIGVVVHPRNRVIDSVHGLTAFAKARGARVVARAADAAQVDPDATGVTLVPEDGFVDRLDALVSLGGDGTMLGAMRLAVGRPVPILGVNHGNLGFLVEVSPAGLSAALARLVADDYTLEPHSCLDIHSGTVSRTAFNDLVVTAVEPFTGMSVDLLVDDVRHGYFRADALVVCTPIGSTAYNYAAGGPIVSPSSQSVVLTPVAPMSGIGRSVVLGADDAITLQNPSTDVPLRLSLDGTEATVLDPAGAVTVRLHPDAVSLVRFDAGDYARRNRVKLSLLDLPLRGDQLLELIPEPLRERAERFSG